jgi:hypothetical protein
VRLHFHNILVNEFRVGDWLTGDNIDHINLAIVIFVSLVIEKDVLCAIVCLVDQEYLATILVLARGVPSCFVVVNGHA